MSRDDIFPGIRQLCMFSILAIFAGCAASSTRVVSSHDPSTDFSQYKSFAFAEPLSVSRNNGVRTSLGGELVMAATRELMARGMQPVSSGADLRIDFFLAQDNGAFVHSHSGMTAWSGYASRSSAARHMAGQIVNGTLIVDVVDTRRGSLVFEGLAEGRITESMRDNLAETVNTTVADIFANMP